MLSDEPSEHVFYLIKNIYETRNRVVSNPLLPLQHNLVFLFMLHMAQNVVQRCTCYLSRAD